MNLDLGEVCGNCKFYERGNAWSGKCVVNEQLLEGGSPERVGTVDTSPGRQCQHEASAFMARGAHDDAGEAPASARVLLYSWNDNAFLQEPT